MRGPCGNLVLQCRRVSRRAQIGEVHGKVFVFAGVELIATKPTEQRAETLPCHALRQDEMRQPGRGRDRLVVQAHLAGGDRYHVYVVTNLDRMPGGSLGGNHILDLRPLVIDGVGVEGANRGLGVPGELDRGAEDRGRIEPAGEREHRPRGGTKAPTDGAQEVGAVALR
jgi:hypothetical protein